MPFYKYVAPLALTESQRDSVTQPRVGAKRLPWVNVSKTFSNPNGVVALFMDATPSGLILFVIAYPA
jgi:hypothetical protein